MLRATRLRCEYLVDPVGIDGQRPRLSWELAAGSPSRRGARQTAYRLQVRRDDGRLAWDSGRVASTRTAQVEYEGARLQPCARYSWRVRAWDEAESPTEWSAEAHWTMGLAHDGPRSLPRSCWVGPRLAAQWSEAEPQPSPYLRASFTVPGPARRAVLFASALGVYEARLNGSRVGDAVLSPEWTDYRTRVQYQGFEVTGMVREGENVLGAVLGPGWYAGQLGLGAAFLGITRGYYGRLLRFAAYLLVEGEDGKETVVATDASWRCTADGPIRASDILGGETYDARREMPGWDQPGFDDSAWELVDVCQGPALTAQPNERIRITQDIAPVSAREVQPGTWILDMGQNMVGWVRAGLRGAAGVDVRIRHAEALNPDGTLYRGNLRLDERAPLWGARQEDHYVCRGSGEEVFEPHFTYHGFRYVEIAGLPAAPATWNVVGRVLHSDCPEAGAFESSHPVLNRIMSAIQWTQRGNMHGIPTDCPQRDERLGWAGDILVFCGTAIYNRDMAAFLTKWLRDMRDAQTADGRFPDFAPHPFGPQERFSGNPGWADAALVIPWRLYQAYGDTRALEEAFEPARRWVDYTTRENPDLVCRDHGRCNPAFYGDWLNADTFIGIPDLPRTGGEVPKEVFATAFFARSAQVLSWMAGALGRADDERRYAALARRARAAFCRAFVSRSARIRGDTQAGYALALHFDLLPPGMRRAAAERLVAALGPYKGALSTGFTSTVPMMLELVRWGHLEEAYRLLERREMPSWAYMVEHGGTTMWERWDGWVEGRGFQNPGMNSFNHYAIGSVGEWVWRVAAGIEADPDAPAAAAFVIHPRPGGGLAWVRAAHHTIRGPVSVEWKTEDGTFILAVSIPPNVTATVVIPGASAAGVTESGAPLSRAPGVTVLGRRAGGCAVRVQSGNYRFVAGPGRTGAG
jgi:alpha-L-rhamnosidase